MGFGGVRRALDAVEGELDALAPALGDDARIELARALERPELGLAVLGPRHAFLGHAGIQLERQPADLDIELAAEELERLLEAALADVAPRADDVGGDFDLHRCFGTVQK